MNLTKECQMERIQQRHGEGGGEALKHVFDLFEPAGQDEENAFNVTVDKGMTREDVVQLVSDVIKNI